MAKVIMYHYILPDNQVKYKGLKGLKLSEFIQQIDFLQKNYNIISAQAFYERILTSKPLDESDILLTFDDGYKEMYTLVLPILDERKLTGSFFIPNYFEDGKLMIVNAIHLLLGLDINVRLLLKEVKELALLHNISNNEFDLIIENTVNNSRYDTDEENYFKMLLQHNLNYDLRRWILDRLIEKYFNKSIYEMFNEFYCTKAQLNEMIIGGMHIGGHGYKHEWLNKMANHEQLIEFEKSYELLQSLNEQPFYSYSYAYGEYNKESVDYCKKTGFAYAFNVIPAGYNNEVDDCYQIPRYDTNDFYPKGSIGH